MSEQGVVVIGLDTVLQAFASLDGRVEDLGWAWPGIAEEWYANTERTINEQDYEPLTEAYAARKAKEFGSNPILVASGEMATALTSSSSPDSIYEPTADSLTVGVKRQSGMKAKAHQEGAGNLPERKVYVITDLFKERVQERVVNDLSAYARQLGFAVQ